MERTGYNAYSRRLFIVNALLAPILLAKPAAKIECVAGCGTGSLGGPAKGAMLLEPFGVAFDEAGNWYICEYKGERISKVDTKGIITLFAGKDQDDLRNSAATQAKQLKFNQPHALVISKAMEMFVADTMNNRLLKIDIKSGRAVTIAGTGQADYSGDGGPALNAAFNQLYAIDLNSNEDKLYITDLRNRRIRLLDLKTGIVRTIAGNGEKGVPENGAEAARSPLFDPRAAAIDGRGNLYILERAGNALRVVDREGKIRTVVDRDLNGPKQLCCDREDNVIIADTENHLIRKYNAKDGRVVVIAGTGEKGDRLVTDDPLQTQLNRPHGVYVHRSGELYISDSENNRVLKMSN